jgi:hypothetical protein
VPRHRRSVSEIDCSNVTIQENQLKTFKKTLSLNLDSSANKTMNKQRISNDSNELPTIVIDTTLKKVLDKAFIKQPFIMPNSVTNKMSEIKSELVLEDVFSSINKLKKNKEMEVKIDKSFISQRDRRVSNEFINNSCAFKNRIDSIKNDALCKSDMFYSNENIALGVNVTSNPLREKKPCNNNKVVKQRLISEVLIISSCDDEVKIKNAKSFIPADPKISPEKMVKKMERSKSKPTLLPLPPSKINRDEYDWDSLFDDNGDCLDPTLIEEVSFMIRRQVILS